MNIDGFLALLDRPRRSGRNYLSRCPGHADRSPSLSIAEGDGGRILLRCFAGCTAEEIVSAMGLSLKDLFPDERADRDAIRRAKRRRETERRAERIEGGTAALRYRAERVIEAARGIDINGWSEAELDGAMDAVCGAYEIIWPERLEEYRRSS